MRPQVWGGDPVVAAASQAAGAGVGDDLQGTVFTDLDVFETVRLNTVEHDDNLDEAAVALIQDGAHGHAQQLGALAVGRDDGGNGGVARGEVHHWSFSLLGGGGQADVLAAHGH